MKIALVGNPNSGKTTLFNALTGMNAKIGNWPGVTIEKKVGIIKGTRHEIVDLPGIYSLSPYSSEEEISRKYIFDEKPDVLIDIIDSTSLERSLYLTTQLMELDSNIIIALNMTDIIEKKGLEIDIDKLENILGAKVIKISALKEIGINELIREIDSKQSKSVRYIYNFKIENLIKNIESALPTSAYNKRFLAVNILQGDERFANFNNEKIQMVRKDIDTDMEEIIATERYDFVEKAKRECMKKHFAKESISDKLDKTFLNKYLAFPIFSVIMFLTYYLSIGVVGKITSKYISSYIEIFSDFLEDYLTSINTSAFLVSLLVDGAIKGVGSVIRFSPRACNIICNYSIA